MASKLVTMKKVTGISYAVSTFQITESTVEIIRKYASGKCFTCCQVFLHHGLLIDDGYYIPGHGSLLVLFIICISCRFFDGY